MRITNGMMVTNMLRDITRNQERMDALNRNLSTGKKFLKPSDDPLGVSKSLRLNTDISTMSQFKRNVEDSQSWLGTTETATDNMIDVLQKVRELTVKGANGTNSPAERGAIASEINLLKDQLINIGNTSYAGSYIFSGYKTDKPLLKSDGTYDLDGTELDNKEIMDVNLGIGDKFGLNFVGQRIFGVMKSLTDVDLPISQGALDYTLKTGALSPSSLFGGDITFDYGEAPTTLSTTVSIGPSPTINDIVNNLNNCFLLDPALKNHLSANANLGYISIVSDKPFKLTGGALLTDLGVGVGTDAVKEEYSLSGGAINLTTTSPLTFNGTDSFDISYGNTPSITKSITLPAKVYNGVVNNLQDLANDIQAEIDIKFSPLTRGILVEVKNNQLFFNSDKPLTLINDSPVTLDLSDLGISSGRVSTKLGLAVKSGEETQLIGMLKQLVADLTSGNQTGISGFLNRLDAHLDNINAVRSEIGVKTNRLELTSNRIDDDTLNLTSLLSKNEDADMAEVIMNLKMEENVYKSSLSGGARIIQLSLLDFLR